MTSYLHTTQVDRASDIVNFAVGQPGFDLLPHDILRSAAAARFAEGDTEFLNYGYQQGDERFRLALAEFLSEQYGIPVSAESLMVTAGASQALDLICTLFTRPGDTVFVEEPSYFIALRILLEDHKLQAVPIPTDENGMDMDALQTELDRQRPTLVYTIPTFQNPSGRTLPAARRDRLVSLAEEHDFLIVADEVYHALSYGSAPPAPLAAATNPSADGSGGMDHVLSIGSFSKILAPGLRLGWVQAAPELVQRLVRCGLVDSGGGLNHFTSNIVRVVLEQGRQDDYLSQLRQTYRERIVVMDEALSAARDRGQLDARWTTPEGGYFFWLVFDEDVDTASFHSRAGKKGVGFLPGVKCSGQRRLRNAMRLSFAHYGVDEIEVGISRLVKVLAGG